MQFSVIKDLERSEDEIFYMLGEARTNFDFFEKTTDTLYDAYRITIKSGILTFLKMKDPIKHKDIGKNAIYPICMIFSNFLHFIQFFQANKIGVDLTGIESLNYKEEFYKYFSERKSNIINIKN